MDEILETGVVTDDHDGPEVVRDVAHDAVQLAARRGVHALLDPYGRRRIELGDGQVPGRSGADGRRHDGEGDAVEVPGKPPSSLGSLSPSSSRKWAGKVRLAARPVRLPVSEQDQPALAFHRASLACRSRPGEGWRP